VSNIAGKAYAMNVITPVRGWSAWLNKFIFWMAIKRPSTLQGLVTLSLIHYARWVMVGRKQFPRLSPEQPEENLRYGYMLFFSNFNGSWDQYVDSFTFTIPSGLDMFWKWDVRYPKSVPLTPFHDYIRYNQIETIHYYNAYPMASANDIKSAKKLRLALMDFDARLDEHTSDEAFQKQFHLLLRDAQHDMGAMRHTPIVSMAAHCVQQRLEQDRLHTDNAAFKAYKEPI
jgi:hypothetical protein